MQALIFYMLLACIAASEWNTLYFFNLIGFLSSCRLTIAGQIYPNKCDLHIRSFLLWIFQCAIFICCCSGVDPPMSILLNILVGGGTIGGRGYSYVSADFLKVHR